MYALTQPEHIHDMPILDIMHPSRYWIIHISFIWTIIFINLNIFNSDVKDSMAFSLCLQNFIYFHHLDMEDSVAQR